MQACVNVIVRRYRWPTPNPQNNSNCCCCCCKQMSLVDALVNITTQQLSLLSQASVSKSAALAAEKMRPQQLSPLV
jgi:hypothetical protein